MRSKIRIPLFLEKLGDLWKQECPDWRFGQLMFNFFSQRGDPFYWEEEQFIKELENFFDTNKKENK